MRFQVHATVRFARWKAENDLLGQGIGPNRGWTDSPGYSGEVGAYAPVWADRRRANRILIGQHTLPLLGQPSRSCNENARIRASVACLLAHEDHRVPISTSRQGPVYPADPHGRIVS